MTTQKITRTRAWCDYCQKGLWSVKKMEVHEKHCTMNPNRVCRVCKTLLGQEPTPLQELIAVCKGIVPNPEAIGFTDVCCDRLHNDLYRAAQQCPACEMAALRQSRIPCTAVPGFDFTAQMQAIWDDVNDEAKQEAEHECQ